MPVNIQPKVTIQNNKQTSQEQKRYKDPLNSWVVKSLSYSNELGACVNEIAPKITFALWVPTFMYLGADIYDKYKSDKMEYSPSRRRALDEAITQGFTSFILPAGAIILGQKLTSPLGKLISGKLSINARETVYEHTINTIEHCLSENINDKDKFIDLLKNSLNNNINHLNNEKNIKNPFLKLHRYMTGYYAATDADKTKLMKFAQDNAESIFELKENLERDINLDKIPKRIYRKYQKLKPLMKELYGDDFGMHAIKSALMQYQREKIFANKLIKTAGGIASLALLLKPINDFVDKIVMPKYVDPKVDKLENKFKENNLLRLHVKKFEDYRHSEQNNSTKILGENAKTSLDAQLNAKQKKTSGKQTQQVNPKRKRHQQTSQLHS